MPRGQYDRSKARPRRKRRTSSAGAASLSKRIEQMSKQLAALSEEVKRTEAVQAALAPFMMPVAGAVTPSGKRRGRPPGSKNKPKAAAAAGAPKRRGRPPGSKNRPKVAAMSVAPRRRGRPRKNPVA